jgi:glycolate oxidase FAD binding subunit
VIERRIRSIVGTDGVFDVGSDGTVEVAPRSEEECALILASAHKENWSVCFRGGGGWIKPDAPSPVIVSTKQLTGISDLSPADLVLTANSGTPLPDLQTAAANEGTWIPLDPPGANRTLGSVLATGTAGPLRTGFGGARSRILGLTAVTAEGRIVRVGGRVVKNVAGFDITSLLVGSFGAFGLITSAHVRLNAKPTVDVTLVARDTRDALLESARTVLASGVTPAAMEVFSHDTTDPDGWYLATRLVGSEAATAAVHRNIERAAAHLASGSLEGDAASEFWASESVQITRSPVTVRVGALPTELENVLDLLNTELDDGGRLSASVSVLAGVCRLSCNNSSEQLANLRRAAAHNSWPVTLERAPWDVRSEVGHYGAYTRGVGDLVESLRSVFDQRRIFAVPLGDLS